MKGGIQIGRFSFFARKVDFGAKLCREETQERATNVGPVKKKEKKRERKRERERERERGSENKMMPQRGRVSCRTSPARLPHPWATHCWLAPCPPGRPPPEAHLPATCFFERLWLIARSARPSAIAIHFLPALPAWLVGLDQLRLLSACNLSLEAVARHRPASEGSQAGPAGAAAFGYSFPSAHRSSPSSGQPRPEQAERKG